MPRGVLVGCLAPSGLSATRSSPSPLSSTSTGVLVLVNSTFPCPIGIDSSLCLLSQHTWRRILPRPIGIDSPLCLLSQHTWRRILPRRCHLDRRRGGCCPATATGANPHHVRRRPERLNCLRPSPFSARLQFVQKVNRLHFLRRLHFLITSDLKIHAII